MKQYREPIKAIKNDLIVIGILLIMSWKIMHGFEYFIDVGVGDEADYLRNGLNILKNGIGKAEYGPLYKIWYYMLSLFEPNRVQLYYFNIKIQSILLPIFSYMLLRRLYVPILESGIIAGFLLICNGNLFTDPRMAQLVIIILLLCFLLATYVYSFASSTLILSIGALLSSYIRPEFFLTYLLLSALFCIVIFSDKEQILGHFHLLILFFLCSLAFMIYIGIPAFSKNSVRSYIAFSDHFALNWASWTKSDLNPWWVVISDGAEITDQTFGHARSIFAAAIYNPSMFGKHIVSNLQNIGKTLYWLLDPQYYRMFQSYNYGFSHKILEISFLFIIVGQYLYTIRERWMSKIMIKEKIENYKKFFIYFLICSIPGLISAIVFFPRNHYLVLPSVLLVIGIAIVFTAERRIQISTSYRELLIMGCFMIMLTPTPEIIHRSFVYEAFGRNENLKTINLLKSLKISADVNLLNAEGEYAVYVSDNYHIIDYWIKNTTFEDFMKEKQINMIALSEKLEKSSKFHDDEQWKYFLVHYENFGYTKINIEGTSRELLVNKDLLK